MKIIKVTRCFDQDVYQDCPYAIESDKGKLYCDHPEVDAFTLEAVVDGIPEGCPLEDAVEGEKV